GELPPLREVPGVAGWAGSQPIRVGNDASGQIQYDAPGLLVEAISVYLQTGGTLDPDTWTMVGDLADEIARDDPESPKCSHGIWEQPEPSMLVDGDIGRWLVLDRAVKIGRVLHPVSSRRRRRAWVAARDTIAARIREAVPTQGPLPQAYGQDPPRADAASLMAVVFGLLDPRQERTRRLVHDTIEALQDYPFLYRYPPDATDGYHGREGAFLPVSFWAVTAQAIVGDVTAAQARMDALCASLPRLLSEEIDPVDGTALGNVPLLWTHAEFARALYVLDAAQLRARWGRAVLWTWRIVRYLQLRYR
ncbi:MAG TPA: glycoside hydrolase family 15 protein, partial [Cryptosporangiaceae bacterium]|nr:glycoside hydrolase family 15 protein [Cryptosporangiaceae bacterium]